MGPFSLHYFSSSFHFGGRNQRSNAAVLPASCVPFSWPHFPIVLNCDTEHHQSATARGSCTPESGAVGGASNEREIWTWELSCFDSWVEPWRVPWCAEPKDFCLFPVYICVKNQLAVAPSRCFWITDDSLCCTNGTLARWGWMESTLPELKV